MGVKTRTGVPSAKATALELVAAGILCAVVVELAGSPRPASPIRAGPWVPLLIAPRRAPPAPAGSASSYKFGSTDSSGNPARWRTCAAIPVVVDSRGATAAVLSELRVALGKIDAAAGVRLTITDVRNNRLTTYESDNPASPVIIGFPDATSGVFTDANEAGLTSTTTDAANTTITGGTIAFNADLVGTYTPGATGADPLEALVLHELGHLVGLAHVNDQTQIMYPYTGYAHVLGAGDLAGLRALAPRGCARQVADGAAGTSMSAAAAGALTLALSSACAHSLRGGHQPIGGQPMADPLTQIVTHAIQLKAEAKGTDVDPETVVRYLAMPQSDTVKAAAAVGTIHRYEGGKDGDDCRWCNLLTVVFIGSLG